MTRMSKLIATLAGAATLAALSVSGLSQHLTGASDGSFAERKDIIELPQPLKDRLVALAQTQSTFPPAHAFNEAVTPAGASIPSQLFQYYLLDNKNFQPNVFTQANGDSLGAARVVLEPKTGRPTDPADVNAAIDTFTDVVGLPVINNEAGFYESWMIHDVVVPAVASPRAGSTAAQFGTITAADAQALAGIGNGNNVAGHILTLDGNAPRFGSAGDVFPDLARQPNVVPIALSLGTFNATQENDAHNYWEFNPGTNWVFPLYETPFTGGGIPSNLAQQYQRQSVIPGSGPSGLTNTALTHGDNPINPRDPDNPTETRNRFVPSGLANEVMLDVYARLASFEPSQHSMQQRIFDAYAAEVARVDGSDHDGVVSFAEAGVSADKFVNGTSDGLPNSRLFLPATAFDRFAVTRELDNGLLAQRFFPSQLGYVLSGAVSTVPAPFPPASFAAG